MRLDLSIREKQIFHGRLEKVREAAEGRRISREEGVSQAEGERRGKLTGWCE